MLRQDVFSTQQFKDMSKLFVFCEIGVDKNPQAMTQFGVQAIPLILFYTDDGTKVHESIGGRAVGDFLQVMEQARNAAVK